MDMIMMLNMRGDVLLSRTLRNLLPQRVHNTFRINVVCAKNVRSPILTVNGITYLHTQSEDLYLVVATETNVDAVCVFEVLFRLCRQFGETFGKPLNDQNLRSHFAFVYEMVYVLM